jgi:hypothetical protein
MTRTRSSSGKPEQDELAQRYAEHGRVEPPAGLDRMIRARAEQAVAGRSPRRPARWVGGLATGMALVLAVVVVIQQQAPQTESRSIPFEPADDAGESLREDAGNEASGLAAPAARREAGPPVRQRAAMDAADRAAFEHAAGPSTASPITVPELELAEPSSGDERAAGAEDSASLRRAIVAAIERAQFERAEALLDALGEQDAGGSRELRARLEAARDERSGED